MNISIVSDANSWMNGHIPSFIKILEQEGHVITWVHTTDEIPDGELAFYLGCGQIVPQAILQRNRHNLVVHESALPKGKGWSPLTWQILEGVNDVPVTLFEASEHVDSGTVYLRDAMHFAGTELIDELREVQARTSMRVCLEFVRSYPGIVAQGVKQQGESTFHARRKPVDSRLDPDRTIREQFNLLRVVDNERYPAFFKLLGETYIVRIEKKI